MWNVIYKNRTLQMGILFTSIISLYSANSDAADVLVNTVGNSNGIVIPHGIPQPYANANEVTVNITADCFGTNLRGVSNPLSPNGTIKAEISTALHGSEIVEIKSSDIRGSAQVYTVKLQKGWSYSLDAGGNITHTGALNDNVTHSFVQQNISGNPGSYYGSNGPLDVQLDKVWSENRTVLNLSASFPGEEGWCGGYHSPLMMFFDKTRPKFSASTDFPLDPGGGKTYWPEKDSGGYFLAMDRNSDGKITNAKELFGNNRDNLSNGFKYLAKLDSNSDGVIDIKDDKFESLVLWKDKNEDGVSQPSELHSLKSKNVEYISLRYNQNSVEDMAGRAELREKSMFTFRDHKGTLKSGEVVDVWFSPDLSSSNGISLANK